jgi:predicted lipid-binding transport protein (Tim44 family)
MKITHALIGLGLLTTSAHGASLTGSSPGYHYFWKAGAAIGEHDAAVIDCAVRTRAMINGSDAGSGVAAATGAAGGFAGGLVGGLIVGIFGACLAAWRGRRLVGAVAQPLYGGGVAGRAAAPADALTDCQP